VALRVLAFVNHVPLRRDPQPMIEQALEWGIDYVVAQGTGKDWGPHWLGSGRQLPVRNFVENVRPYMKACHAHGIPFILSAGIAGARPQLTECIAGFNQMCREEELSFDLGVVPGDVDPMYLIKRIAAGDQIRRMDEHPALPEYLRAADVEDSVHIVAQIGPEPIMEALDAGVDGVVTGRALDVGLFMAPALRAGATKASAALFGKLLECGGVALEPVDASLAIYGELHDDGSIVVRSPSTEAECRVQTLAAHSFYERMNPFREENPGGYLNLDQVTYEQLDARSVKVSGAQWVDTPYSVKLEGAAPLGYRAINLSGARDPRYLAHLDAAVGRIKTEVRASSRFGQMVEEVDYHLNVTLYGRDAVLGEAETRGGDEHEVGVLIDVVAPTQALAEEICYFAAIGNQNWPYPGRKTTAGNVAQRFTEIVNPLGEIYRWSIWHLLPLDDPTEPFPVHRLALPTEEAVGW